MLGPLAPRRIHAVLSRFAPRADTVPRALFDRIADPVFVFDKKTHRFLDCNATAERLYGYGVQELRRMTPHDLHPVEERSRVAATIEVRNTATGFSYTHVTKSGQRKQVEILSDEIDYRGRPAWISVVRDITARTRTEQALRESERRQRALVESLPDALLRLGPEGAILDFRPAHGSGARPEDWSGRAGGDFFPAAVRRRALDAIEQVRCSGAAAGFEFAADGSHFEARVVGAGNGETLVLVRDVTQRHRLEAERERLASFPELNPMPIVELDLDGGVHYANAEARRVYPDLVARAGEHPLLLGAHALARTLVEAGESSSQCDVRCGDTWYHQLVHVVEGGRRTRLYSFDITARKAMESQLIEAKEAAEAGTRARDEFLANVGHELRTPIHAVLGMGQILLAKRLRAEERECVETIQSSASALLATLSDILELSKIESGTMSLEASPFDVAACIDGVVQEFRRQAESKGLRLEHVLAAQLPRFLVGDAGRLRQVLAKLVGNAIKFTPDGHVRIEVESGPASAGRCEIHGIVEDTGIGIPAQERARLFKSFSQVDASITRHFGGTGLGLAISRRLCERMGGQMWVESEAGNGSRFHFTIVAEVAAGGPAPSMPHPGGAAPRTAALDTQRPDERIPTSEPQTATQEGEMNDLQILIAEDNMVNQKVALKMLAHLGFAADVVANGLEALEALGRKTYDVVLMDVMMPEMDGLEATRAIRRQWPGGDGPRIIATTANAMKGDREKCLDAGMDDYISKPVRMEDLQAALRRWGMRAQETAAAAPAAPPAAAPSEPEVIDMAAVDALSELQEDGGPDIVSELIELFIEDSVTLLADLEGAVQGRDCDAIGRIAHRFKGSSANLGARILASQCQALEACGKQGNTSGLEALHAGIRSEFERAERALRRLQQVRMDSART